MQADTWLPANLDIISTASGLNGPVLFDEWKNTGSVSQLNLGPRGAYPPACTAAAACATAATQIADITEFSGLLIFF